MNWAKIHKSTEKNNGEERQPKLDWIGPVPGSAKPGGLAEPPSPPLDLGFGWTVEMKPQWQLEGITDHSNRHNRHSSAIKGVPLLTSHTHLKQ